MANILSHIIPARTRALGAGAMPLGVEVTGNFELRGFTESSYDHSAVFHGALSDPVKGRRQYWQSVLEDVFEFVRESDDYSKLTTSVAR